MTIDFSGKCTAATGSLNSKDRDAVAATLQGIASHAGLLLGSCGSTAAGGQKVETITVSGSSAEYVMSVSAAGISVVQRRVDGGAVVGE